VIRYVDLNDQIVEGCFEFAWFDTVTDRFFDIDGEQTWESWKDFKHDLVMYMVRGRVPEQEQNETLARFFKLYPKRQLRGTGT
jgi:hypothetical protein